MTSYAIRRDDSGKLGGVNFVENFSEKPIGSSVVHLKMRASHRAAFAYATYNIGVLMRGLSIPEQHRLATSCPTNQLGQVVAVAHHQPVGAIQAAHRWVAAGCNKPYTTYLNTALRDYASKTEANYEAIEYYKNIHR